ncbi:hypothetical protein VTK73DRAFT_9718 [Phialemonium thermophilum]|uniref:CsbD-like domain-containing protein n=1 Tax=Phialemonium thermophilum TaxID=223376 RepID=A0ABR3XJ31_9PEZI
MSNTNNENPSTLKSYIDSAAGRVQNAFGNITGNTDHQAEGAAKQQRAQEEYDASHATAKLPGYTASTAGAVTKDDPNRTTGSWNQTVGSAKEALGGLVGSESLKETGRQQNREGQEQEARGQVNDFASGVADRTKGTLGNAAAGLTGDRAKQEEYQRRHDEGKTKQRGAEHDIQKQAEAERETSSNNTE